MATLESRLPQVAAELRRGVAQAVKAGAEVIAASAREKVPVGAPSVHLKDKITVERRGPAEYAVVAGDDEVFYAHMVEFGTSHSAPRPFLVPAKEEKTAEAVALVNAVLHRL